MKKVFIAMTALALIACSIANKQETELKKLLAERFKMKQTEFQVEKVKELKDVFEISLFTGEVFYSDSKAEILMIGRMIDKNDKDLTLVAEEKQQAIKIKTLMSSLNKNLAVKIGSGNKEIIEFTDIECPYCYQAEGFFSGKNEDVTRYIFFTPLDQIHPNAAKKTVHILCSADKAAEYIKVINNEVQSFTTCASGEEALKKHRAYGVAAGVRGTPHFIIDNKTVVGADPKIVDLIEAK